MHEEKTERSLTINLGELGLRIGHELGRPRPQLIGARLRLIITAEFLPRLLLRLPVQRLELLLLLNTCSKRIQNALLLTVCAWSASLLASSTNPPARSTCD